MSARERPAVGPRRSRHRRMSLSSVNAAPAHGRDHRSRPWLFDGMCGRPHGYGCASASCERIVRAKCGIRLEGRVGLVLQVYFESV